MPDKDKPSEDVINDDLRLDRWFIEKDAKSGEGNVYDDRNIVDYKPRRSFGD